MINDFYGKLHNQFASLFIIECNSELISKFQFGGLWWELDRSLKWLDITTSPDSIFTKDNKTK